MHALLFLVELLLDPSDLGELLRELSFDVLCGLGLNPKAEHLLVGFLNCRVQRNDFLVETVINLRQILNDMGQLNHVSFDFIYFGLFLFRLQFFILDLKPNLLCLRFQLLPLLHKSLPNISHILLPFNTSLCDGVFLSSDV
jgi:hypothetical protein